MIADFYLNSICCYKHYFILVYTLFDIYHEFRFLFDFKYIMQIGIIK